MDYEKLQERKRKMVQIGVHYDNQPRISRVEYDGIYRIENQLMGNQPFSGGQSVFIGSDI